MFLRLRETLMILVGMRKQSKKKKKKNNKDENNKNKTYNADVVCIYN